MLSNIPLVLADYPTLLNTIRILLQQSRSNKESTPEGMIMTTRDLVYAVARIQYSNDNVRAAVDDQATAVTDAAQPMLDALHAFLSEQSTSITEVQLPADLAGCIADIWAAGYAWKQHSEFWEPLRDFVEALLNGTEWVVDRRPNQTSNPNPRNEDDLKQAVQIVLVRN